MTKYLEKIRVRQNGGYSADNWSLNVIQSYSGGLYIDLFLPKAPC